METLVYQPKNKIRIVTAASLFDGHDAAINIMRSIIQSSGAEVIHLGHDRSCGRSGKLRHSGRCTGHCHDQSTRAATWNISNTCTTCSRSKGAGHIRIFGGGGGTILPSEIEELHQYGIARIYHPDDGRSLGLQGMINDLVAKM
jgi:isobutyryl-CoA mutase